MKKAPVRHRIEYFFYRATKLGLLRLSHRGVRRFGRFVGRIAYRVLSGQRKKAMRNLELTLPELGAERHRAVTRACFEHFGAYFCEIVSASRFNREEILELFDIEGWEHVDAAEAAGRGYLFMCGHYGCWELAAFPLGIRLGRLFAVARPANNPFVERDVARIRDRFGNVLIGKKGAGFRMLNAARRGEHVAMVIDQKVRPSAGIRVPFLGQPAWTSPVLAFVSLHTRSPVVTSNACTSPGGLFR